MTKPAPPPSFAFGYLMGLLTAVGVYMASQLWADHLLLHRVVDFISHAQ
jgi:hypothetical protein